MSPVAALTIDWAVVNNFALLKGSETQDRFGREVDTYLACLRRTGDVSDCSEGQTADGLTQRPFAVRFDRRTARYTTDLVHPAHSGSAIRLDQPERLSVRLTVTGVPDGARCRWTVDGHLHTDQPCRSVVATVRLDSPADVRVALEGESDTTGETTVVVRRRVIVALGDSFMSGEGNPHRRRSVVPLRAESWLEERCHRSLLAASALAAFRFAQAHPKLYVAYLNLACSGSTIGSGLLGPYEGVLSARRIAAGKGLDDPRDFFRGARLPSQIDQAKSALCRGSGAARSCVSPDLVLLGVGVNDLGFRRIVETLAGTTCAGSCLQRLERYLATRLTRLTGAGPGSLKRVLDTIDRDLTPKRALTVAYSDPTRRDDGAFCDASILSGGSGPGRIDARENAWAFEKVLTPLDAALMTVTTGRTTWRHLAATATASSRHGYCARIPHFNTGLEANVEAGTMHPNALGHDAVARVLVDAMADLARD